MSEYNFVAKGKLKLKNDSLIKKKKKSKNKACDKDAMQETLDAMDSKQKGASNNTERKLTKAEAAFKQQNEKMRNKRILEKASTTHKQRVEKFNEHLDTLTEHFDIPKVSWTK